MVIGTAGVKLPQGTTAQQPVSPTAGAMRYNTTLKYTEIYDGATWVRFSNSAKPGYNSAAITTYAGTHLVGYYQGFKTHTFLSGSHTFTPSMTGTVEVLVVGGGGGGGGGGYGGGGGGGGGFIYNTTYPVVANTPYNVIVGSGGYGGAGGGTNSAYAGTNGQASAVLVGPELITNGSFNQNATGWASQASASNTWYANGGGNGGGCVGLTSVGGSNVYNSFTFTGLTVSTRYVISWIAKGAVAVSNTTFGVGDSMFVNNVIVGTSQPLTTSYQNYSYTFVATATTMYFNVYTASTTTYIDNLSVQATSASLVAFGGGRGGAYNTADTTQGSGGNGGSGGGGGSQNTYGTAGSLIVYGQGFAGGAGINAAQDPGGGGGGASGPGVQGASGVGGDGGPGICCSISGLPTYYSGGGGGGCYSGRGGSPGAGGAGAGNVSNIAAKADYGLPNTGGGGGGGSQGATLQSDGGDGGSGLVIIRYVNNGPSYVSQSFLNTTAGGWLCPPGVTSVDVLVVAGGGSAAGGGSESCGGGGAGGYLYQTGYPVTPGTYYPVTVGAGGIAVSGVGNGGVGSNSIFGSITAIGGGRGGSGNGTNGGSGGSGGGGSGWNAGTGGSNTAGQGFPGGNGRAASTEPYSSGGGGGAGGAGTNADTNKSSTTYNVGGGDGGPGLPNAITGVVKWYAGGGGGTNWGSSRNYGTPGRGGIGGGGNGAYNLINSSGFHGLPNTGGGGGGGSGSGYGGNGGTGIVVVRWIQQ